MNVDVKTNSGRLVGNLGLQRGIHVVTTGPTAPAILPGYVVGYHLSVSKNLSTSERDQAMQVRSHWMQQMGISEEEIREACEEDGPVSLAEELENLRASKKLGEATPPAAELSKWAIKY